jgi:hypothetical protein
LPIRPQGGGKRFLVERACGAKAIAGKIGTLLRSQFEEGRGCEIRTSPNSYRPQRFKDFSKRGETLKMFFPAKPAGKRFLVERACGARRPLRQPLMAITANLPHPGRTNPTAAGL